ncbi:MAG: carboxypeptidase regulatory-like domain-containing protein [Anaerolineae bacterium]
MIARKSRIVRTGGVVLAALVCWFTFYAFAAQAARPSVATFPDIAPADTVNIASAPSDPGAAGSVSALAETAAPPVVAVSPVSGTQVSNFTITGAGFTAGQSVQLTLLRPDGLTLTYPVTVNAQGGFQPAPISGVGMPLGTYTLQASANQAELAHAQFRIGSLPPFCQDLLANGGFELTPDFVDWDTSGTPLISTSSPFSGQRLALLAGYNSANDRVAQNIVLPADTQLARLSYWRARVPESATPDSDRMTVALLRPDGLPAATVETVDATTAANSWGRVLYSLPAGGQTLRLAYSAMTDTRNRTAYGVDEVSLIACSQVPTDPGGQPAMARAVTSGGGYAIAPGERTRVEVWLEDVTNLYSADVTLSFDPSIVHAVPSQADLGPFLYLPGQSVMTQNVVDNTAGTVRVVMTRLSPAPTVSGSGVLFSLEFEGVAVGVSPLSVTRVLAAQLGGTPINAGAHGASLTVRPAPAAIIGRMTLEGRTAYNATTIHGVGPTDQTVLTNNLGDFRLDGLAAGQYTVRARRPGWLCAEQTVTLAAGQTVDLSAGQLIAGDVVLSDVIDIFDLVRVSSVYDSPSSTDPISDLNGNGRIDIGDVVLVAANFGLACPQVWSPPNQYAAQSGPAKRGPVSVRLVPQAPGKDGTTRVEIWADDLTGVGGVDLTLGASSKAVEITNSSPFRLGDALKDAYIVRNARTATGARLALTLPAGARAIGPVRLATIDVSGDATALAVAGVTWADSAGRLAGDAPISTARETPPAAAKKPSPSGESFGGRREVLDNWQREAALPLR